MIRITHNVYPQERALYNTRNAEISDCKFCGEQDGESALKKSSNIVVGNCLFDLRYPLWHVNGALVANCTLTENCRAAMWYDKDIAVVNSKLHGIKAMRECSNVELFDSDVISPEFCWKCSNVDVSCCNISGDYAFMQCSNVWADNLTVQGKYSFQYVSNATFHNCKFNTKDAFGTATTLSLWIARLTVSTLVGTATNLLSYVATLRVRNPCAIARN